jgi:hypothetical protein
LASMMRIASLCGDGRKVGIPACSILRFGLFFPETPTLNALRNLIQLCQSDRLFHLVLVPIWPLQFFFLNSEPVNIFGPKMERKKCWEKSFEIKKNTNFHQLFLCPLLIFNWLHSLSTVHYGCLQKVHTLYMSIFSSEEGECKTFFQILF